MLVRGGDLTLQKVQEIARALEAVDVQVKRMNSVSNHEQVNKIYFKSAKPKENKPAMPKETIRRENVTVVVWRGTTVGTQYAQLRVTHVGNATKWVIGQ